MLSTFMDKKELLLKSIEDELSNELNPLLVSASESGADIFSLDNHNPNKAVSYTHLTLPTIYSV